MGHIYIARHGPTHHDKLDTETYGKVYVPKISKTISTYGAVTCIYTSPIERCVKSAQILARKLGLTDDKIIKTDELLRFDRSIECSCITKARATKFGRKLRKSKENALIVTHSSIIRHILSGLAQTYFKRFYINEGSVTIFNNKTKKILELNQDLDIDNKFMNAEEQKIRQKFLDKAKRKS